MFLLSLTFDKTHYIHFITKNNYFVDLKLGYSNKQIDHICNTELLGIVIDDSLSWKLHTEQIIPKLSAVCYAVRSFKPYILHEILKMGYHSSFHSILTHELIFLGSSSYSVKIFNPLNPELNPICYLLALLGAHHFLHVSRIRVKLLTFRRLISYIYGAPILDVSRSHTTTQHSQ